jgi:methionyl-tRNA formyltransferase
MIKSGPAVRALFMVGTRRGYLALKAAIEAGVDVCAVISFQQHPHESERYEAHIAELARAAGLPCYETNLLRDRDYGELIRHELRPDVAYLIGVRVIVPKSVYEAIPLGALAAHDSVLPGYRGFAPLNWSILNGETQTGVSLFRLVASMDEGAIVGQRKLSIGAEDTAAQVLERVCDATNELVLETYGLACEENLASVAQDSTTATYTCSRTPTDGLIDWKQSTQSIFNQIRALGPPFPGAYTYHRGIKMTICTARPVDQCRIYVGRIPGRVVEIDHKAGSIEVLTGDGILRIGEVQMGDSEPVAASKAIRSIRDSLGIDLPSILERLERLETVLERLTKSDATRNGLSED